MAEPAEIDGRPASGPRFLNRAVVLLQTADAHPPSRGQEGELGALLQGPTNQSAGDDRAESRHGKGAVDRQPGPTNVGTLGGFCELRVKRPATLVPRGAG